MGCFKVERSQQLLKGSSWESKHSLFSLELKGNMLVLDRFPRVLPSRPESRDLNTLFLKNVRSSLEDELRLPLKPLKTEALITLITLRDAYQTDDTQLKLPFSPELLEAFEKSRKARRDADRCLLCVNRFEGWRGWTIITLACVITVVATISFATLYPDTPTNYILIGVPLLAGFGALLAGYGSMVFTGTRPHAAGVAADAEQNKITLHQQRFDLAADLLTDLYHSTRSEEKALAIGCANKINVTLLRNNFHILSVQHGMAHELFDRIEDAVCYVRNKESGKKEDIFFYTNLVDRFDVPSQSSTLIIDETRESAGENKEDLGNTSKASLKDHATIPIPT